MGRRTGGPKRDGEEGPRPRIDIEALKKTTKCHQCHEVGHWRRECPHNPDNQVQEEEEEEEEVQAPPVRKVTVTKSQTTKGGTSAPRAPVPQAPKISTGSKVYKQMPFIVEGDKCYQFDPVTGRYVDGEEGCTLGAVLEVDQRGPFVEADVDGHPTTFLVDTGASRSTVRSAVVPNLPLSGQTIQVVGVANRRMTNPLTEPVPVKIGSFSDRHQFVVCDSSPVCLLGRDLLCKLNCTIYCTPKGVELQTNDDDADFKVANTHTCIELYPAITVEELLWDLRDSVSPEVWDFTGEEIGLIKGVEPVRIQVRQNVEFPRTPQYKVTPETLEGIKPVIESMVRQGILKEVMGSPCNSPIMGLQKPSGKFRIVQDLRKINNIVVPCCPVVPNPSVILFQIPFQAEWFSSQFLFAFKIESRVLTWCRIPQGYTESPSIFNQLLKRNLESLVLPQNSVLVQYIDDLLVASDTEDACRIDTIALLNHLGKNGHKVSPSKLQYCLQEVQYLGHRIEKGKRKVSPDRIETIMRMSVPSTQREGAERQRHCMQTLQEFSFFLYLDNSNLIPPHDGLLTRARFKTDVGKRIPYSDSNAHSPVPTIASLDGSKAAFRNHDRSDGIETKGAFPSHHRHLSQISQRTTPFLGFFVPGGPGSNGNNTNWITWVSDLGTVTDGVKLELIREQSQIKCKFSISI
ncbi:uncharacterized protein LOC144767334 [Lissotriton helveticus]